MRDVIRVVGILTFVLALTAAYRYHRIAYRNDIHIATWGVVKLHYQHTLTRVSHLHADQITGREPHDVQSH